MPKIAIIGAGFVGSLTAMRTVESGLADVVLIDKQEGLAAGKAMDLAQATAFAPQAASISGGSSLELAGGAQVVVITAGFPRAPGMSRLDLLRKNAGIVREVGAGLKEIAPDSILLVVTNPLDEMSYLAWRVSGFPSERVMGMAGMLDAARYRYFAASALGASPAAGQVLVLGTHAEGMVPLTGGASVSGTPLSELLSSDELAGLEERTVNGGAEIVSLLKTGSAHFAPSAAIFSMLQNILLDEGRIMTASVLLQGEYGLHDLFLGVPVRLGSTGVREIIELELSEEESRALEAAALSTAAKLEDLELG
jgi:malate dehydrogenase